MRKITAGLFMSIDGVIADPQDWHFPYFDDAMGAAVDAQLGSADTLLLGRGTYEGFAGAWPDREADGGPDAGFAKKLGDARKLVVTHQENPELSWRNSERLDGELTEAAAALRNEDGGDIAISGSVSVVRQLLAAGLLDELHLLVHPIAVGKGERLLEDSAPIPLRLLSSETFGTGVLHLVYTRDENAPTGSYEEAKAHLD
ncbi:dihydrofolate reductase [Nocardia neocaledoniensis NBRC 108232]|uniref:Dihydrofolate reductase n=1 Tax=Nocardia neocaledoniensis TaxID=236511 RepID=A0A317NSX2_9NOCA|nr:dihydrofolate reductase family protein [Nocardia neocaledoniensis]PWV77524.1 dihydrofolate reductase [Nocardia neocaledoniensis]GEM32361.1 dihydrofolate reductase [Nocardia neocaledoniensis NBRC 108232]